MDKDYFNKYNILRTISTLKVTHQYRFIGKPIGIAEIILLITNLATSLK